MDSIWKVKMLIENKGKKDDCCRDKGSGKKTKQNRHTKKYTVCSSISKAYLLFDWQMWKKEKKKHIQSVSEVCNWFMWQESQNILALQCLFKKISNTIRPYTIISLCFFYLIYFFHLVHLHNKALNHNPPYVFCHSGKKSKSEKSLEN